MSSFSEIAYDAFGQASQFVMHAATGNRMLGATALGAGALAITSVVAVRKASSTTDNNSKKALYATALASAVAAVGLTYLAYTQYKADLTVKIYPKNWVEDIGAVKRNSEDIAQAEFEKQYRQVAASIQKAGEYDVTFSYNKPEFIYQPVKNALGHILKDENGAEVRVPTVTYKPCTEDHLIEAKCTWSWRNALSLLLHPSSPHCETTLTVGSYYGTPRRAMPSDLPPAASIATALNSTDRSYAVALLFSSVIPLALGAFFLRGMYGLTTPPRLAGGTPYSVNGQVIGYIYYDTDSKSQEAAAATAAQESASALTYGELGSQVANERITTTTTGAAAASSAY